MAVRDRSGLKTVAGSRFADNTSGAIEELDHRDQHGDHADSSVLWEDDVLDEDDMTSNSDEAVPTQQSVKAYVDSQVAAGGATAGEYTPTATAVTNVDSCTGQLSFWTRIGNYVTVYGSLRIDATTTGPTESTVVRLTLPVNSNFANDYELAGVANEHAGTNKAGIIKGTTTLGAVEQAEVIYLATANTAEKQWWFTFRYKVI